jgi:hypothetical protein
MKPLPMPIRIAAGLVATALEEVQELPRKLTEMPVTAVSGALQASMRLQQRITELAIKGDRALGALRPVPETPAWARFDEDEDLPPRGGVAGGLGNGLRTVDTPRPPKVTPVRILPDPEPEDIFEPDAFAQPERSDLPVPRPPVEHPGNGLTSGNGLPDAAELSAPPTTAPPTTEPPGAAPSGKPASGRTDEAERPATRSSSARPANARRANGRPASAKPSPAKPSTAKPSASKPAAKPAAGKPAATKPAKDKAEPAPSGPPGLTEYETWSLPQLRGRFRALSLAQLEQLLAWETSHLDRPPYVTMLSNRITSVAGR